MKKYFAFIGFPVLFRGLYLLDTLALPGTEVQDQPYSYYTFYARKGSSQKHFVLGVQDGEKEVELVSGINGVLAYLAVYHALRLRNLQVKI